jgi:hypothetical protein
MIEAAPLTGQPRLLTLPSGGLAQENSPGMRPRSNRSSPYAFNTWNSAGQARQAEVVHKALRHIRRGTWLLGGGGMAPGPAATGTLPEMQAAET